MDEATIRRRVREMVLTGEMPCEDTAETWGGAGDGRRCAACAEAITPDEVEYEVALRSGRLIRLHQRCHAIWLEECEPDTTPTSAVP